MAYLKVGLDPNGVVTAKGSQRSPFVPPSDALVEKYIVESAVARGIDPAAAIKVWEHEGKGAWQSNYKKGGKREPSFGPFQLLVGGGETGFPTGLGNQFKQETGLDPADPQNWQKTVDYALDKVKEGGWGPWYGAKRAGITGKMGVGGTPYDAINTQPQASPPSIGGRFGLPTAPGLPTTNVGDVVWDKFGMKKTPSGRALPTESGGGGGGFGSMWRDPGKVQEYAQSRGIDTSRAKLEPAPPRSAEVVPIGEAPSGRGLAEAVRQGNVTAQRPVLNPTSAAFASKEAQALNISNRVSKAVRESPELRKMLVEWVTAVQASPTNAVAQNVAKLDEILKMAGY